MKRPNPTLLAVGVIVAAAFYRPIGFWTINAWELSSPIKLILIGVGVAIGAIAVFMLVVRLGIKPLAAGLAIGGLLMLLARWQQLPGTTGPLLVGMVLVVAWLAERMTASKSLYWLAIWFVAAFGFVPILQLAVVHFQDSKPYSLLKLPSPELATASGLIEDVLLVVVDTYPNLQIGQTWFGHKPDHFVEQLQSNGFTVQPGAWSRHTYTSLSVSGILELKSVVEEGPSEPWGNRSSLWQILRGENFVSQTLRSAGFSYTHIESGWEGTSCGPLIDRCVESPWIDELVWELLRPTIVHDWIKERHFIVTGTFNTANALEQALPSLINNDSHDYVFAHLLLPHDPLFVNSACEPSQDLGEFDLSSWRDAFAEQMSCVDLLLASLIEGVDEDTAVLITGDHGSRTGGQVGRSPDDWSDADVAERFSVFMAYRVPPSCDPPSLPDPMVAMNAILACAVGETFTTPPPEYLIGFEDLELVEPDRMQRIQAEVEDGSLQPEEG